MARTAVLLRVVGALAIALAAVFFIVHGSIIHGPRAAPIPRGIHALRRVESPADRQWRHQVAQKGIAHGSGAQSTNKPTTTAAPAPTTTEPHQNTPPPAGPNSTVKYPARDVDPVSIFVSIASWRDAECAPTIADMYARAKFPRSLYLGVVEQHDASLGDKPCIPPELARVGTTPDATCEDVWCPGDNIAKVTIDPRKAAGPTFGRYQGMLLYTGQRYYMMIDSHNRFATHWDEILIHMYQGLDVPKGVLSHYPEAWINPKDRSPHTNAPLDNRGTTTYLCTAKFVSHLGYPRLDGFVMSKKPKCRPQPWAAAGFLFADAKLLREVPFDPHLHYVFDGEEILYSVRMWTHGWDIFSPSQSILYHYYGRSGAPKFWSMVPQGWTEKKSAAERRIQRLLKTVDVGSKKRHVQDNSTEEAVLVDVDKYNLGTERTLEQWYEYAGVDRLNHKLTRNFCKEFG